MFGAVRFVVAGALVIIVFFASDKYRSLGYDCGFAQVTL